jgi:uncharacterized protein YyaL (SSP411 family)
VYNNSLLRFFFFCLILPGCSTQPESGDPVPQPPPQAAPRVQWESSDQPIAWSRWDEKTLERAQQQDKPVLLYLAASGYDGMFHRDYPVLASLVEERFIGVHLDPYRRPDLAQRFATDGWPSLVFILPDGRPFTRAVDVPAPNMAPLLLRQLDHFDQRRSTIEKKVSQRQQSATRYPFALEEFETAVRRHFSAPMPPQAQGPFFIEGAGLLFLLESASAEKDTADWQTAQRHLDTLLQSPVWDAKIGGFRAYSHTPDWRTPADEKDAADQAAMLDALVQAAGRDDRSYGPAARLQLRYIVERLYDPELGYFIGRQVLTAAGWWNDPAFYAGRNALLSAAVMRAAAALSQPAAMAKAKVAMDFLVDCCLNDDGSIYHYYADGQPAGRGFLQDQAAAGLALLHIEGGRDRAGLIMDFMEKQLLDTKDASFRPYLSQGPDQSGAPSYEDGLHPAGNGLAAQLYLNLGDMDGAQKLLSGKSLSTPAGLVHSTWARAILHHNHLQRKSL